MIVKDEERFLNDALRSVAGVVDEICIVDTGSSDGTLAIARAHGARVAEIAWNDDFAQARNAALDLATRPWIFVLDADERLAAESRAAVAAIGRRPVDGRGRWINCRNLTDDCKGAGALSNMLVRIFPNHPRMRYRNAIHEFIALDQSSAGLRADRTTIEIIHHGYLGDVVAERAKRERNLRLSRRAAERDPADPFHQYNLGMALVFAGRHDDAIAALERMRELTAESPRGFRVHGLVVLAELHAQRHAGLATAIARIAECLTCVPNYSNAHYTHGKLLVRAGDYHAAREAFARAVAAGAYDADQFVVDGEIAVWKAHAEIGATLMQERRFAAALAWFELAAAGRPEVQPVIINRAKCHEALGDQVAAAGFYVAAFERFHDEAAALELINFLFRCGRTPDALDAIDAALPFVDGEARLRLLGTAAAALLRCGRVDRARAAVDDALDCADPAAAAALAALAAHFGSFALADLVRAAAEARAKPAGSAYVCSA